MKRTAVFLILVYIKCIYSAPCTTYPVAEGSTATVTKIIPNNTLNKGNLQWQLINSNGNVLPLTICNAYDNSSCTSPVRGNRVYSSTIEKHGPSDYLTTLTLHKVKRVMDQRTWQWVSGSDVIDQCDLEAYSFQSSPVCEDFGVSNGGNTVTWTCTVSKVFPSMECRFMKKRVNESYEMISAQYVRTQHTTTRGFHPPRSTYHDYNCTLRLPLSGLGDDGQGGNYRLRFTAAVVIGSNKTLETKSSGVEMVDVAHNQTANEAIHRVAVLYPGCHILGGQRPGRSHPPNSSTKSIL